VLPARERKVILVTRRTRLEELLARHHTREQARFYVEHSGADFEDYVHEHETYQFASSQVLEVLRAHGRYQMIERRFTANFLFGPQDVVIALGQDGLVANTMKYLDDQPLIGVNPDPARWDGVLLPFVPNDVGELLPAVLADAYGSRAVTMAQARLANGQVLHAVNDLFVGPKSHTSARYEITLGRRQEVQSSSGVIVATGLGSTGWMRSVMTGALAVASLAAGTVIGAEFQGRAWEDEALEFAVREPFPSRSSAATVLCGRIERGEQLVMTSRMAEGGVIFSDGIEADYLEFNAGTRVEIGVASRRGRLVSAMRGAPDANGQGAKAA
jgi:NAD kinase